MAYFGRPSPQGKFFRGASSDTPVNHDLHWRHRVEKELQLLAKYDDELHKKQEALTGEAGSVRDYEDQLIRQAVRKHGGNWARIFADDAFAPLRKYTIRDLAQRWSQLQEASTAR